MNLYLISQDENRDYDTYDSAVVCARTAQEARLMSPRDGKPCDFSQDYSTTWCSSPEKVKVELIGTAAPGSTVGVVCSSFNAG